MKIWAPFQGLVLLFIVCCLTSACGTGISGSSDPGPTLPAPTAVSTGPQLGYTWDTATHALRPILGVPGSSQFGQPITAAGLYVTGAASANSSIGLVQETDGSIDTVALPSGSATRIGGVTVAAGTTILFSPSGQNAILFAPGGTSVTLLTALGGTPVVQSLTAPAPGFSAPRSVTRRRSPALMAVVLLRFPCLPAAVRACSRSPAWAG